MRAQCRPTRGLRPLQPTFPSWIWPFRWRPDVTRKACRTVPSYRPPTTAATAAAAAGETTAVASGASTAAAAAAGGGATTAVAPAALSSYWWCQKEARVL